jgi:hypothetical protein
METGKHLGGTLRVLPVLAVLVAGVLVPVACGDFGEADQAAIDEGRFIEVYVALRMAALEAGTDQLPTDERDRILAEHDVTENDLLEFVEVHGRNAQFMHGVWDSIEGKIDDLRVALPDPPADSVND